MITCRLREGNFEKSLLAEFGCDARFFAGDREGCCVGGTWRGRAVSGDRVAPWNSGVEKPYFNSNQTKDTNDDNDVDDSFCIR